MPSSTVRSCCSLYSLNLGFCVFWLLVFAIMIIARDVVRIVVCLCFCLVHTAVVVVFRLKFKRFGRPERPYNANDLVSGSVQMLLCSCRTRLYSATQGFVAAVECIERQQQQQ
jgi:hypothetical protein